MTIIKLAANAIALVSLYVVWLLVASVGPVIEEDLFPVLTNQKPYVTRTGDKVVMEIAAFKARDCNIVSLFWQVASRKPNEDVVARAPISVSRSEGIPDIRVTYPPGHLRNGPFIASLPASYVLATEIIGNIEYRCHPFWLTPQVYGPFPIPRTP